MARQLMAVCVVCLLCADHFPCQEHIETLFPAKQNSNKNLLDDRLDQHEQQLQQYQYQQQRQYAEQIQMQMLNAKVFQRTDMPMNPSTDSTATQPYRNKKKFNYNNNNNNNNEIYNENDNINKLYNNNNNNNNNKHQRQKRHAGHGVDETHQDHPEITEYFLNLFLRQFGNIDGTIEMQDFQRFLHQLGLSKLMQHNLSIDKESCISDTKLMEYIRPHISHIGNSKVDCSILVNGSKPHPQCLQHHTHDKDDKDHKLDMHNNNNYTLTAEDILNVCPVLLYQLASQSESSRSGCINESVLSFVDNLDAAKIDAEKENIFHVWIYAFTSVFACSILGLVGVAIIPFMDSRYYKHIIQFLVSLAVGTMTGDALLHLLPHSLAGQTEQNMIFKGLTCMGGIIFFYITEHGLTMISEWRKQIAKRETVKPSRAKVVRDPDSSMTNSVAGDKLCKSKYSSYPYCYDEITKDTKNDIHLPATRKLLPQTKDGLEQMDGFIIATDHKRNGITELDANETAAQSLLSTSQNNYMPTFDMSRPNNIYHPYHHDQHQHNHSHPNNHQQQQPIQHLPDSNTISTDLDVNSMGDPVNGNADVIKDKTEGNDTVTVILREHESSHHGHSHKHGHVHSPPESLSAVAWMIIMGDGLHNFTDGMAIGAAFAENIAGGFSTSLAVFCHELPHELGDFAILLKAGMSVRTAVYYNLLTGLLSFIGMIFGIVFGQSQETAQWMFAAAAGLFIYIALVDMMPELSSSHKTIEQFILQILGMSSGVLIMLLIAIYEGDLMNVFSSSSSGENH